MKTCNVTFGSVEETEEEIVPVKVTQMRRKTGASVFKLSSIYNYYISIKYRCLVQCRSQVANRRCRHMKHNIAGLGWPIRNALTQQHGITLQCQPGRVSLPLFGRYPSAVANQRFPLLGSNSPWNKQTPIGTVASSVLKCLFVFLCCVLHVCIYSAVIHA